MMETTFYTLCAYLPIHLLGVAWVIAADRPELVPAVAWSWCPSPWRCTF
ncbi:hypothetical protein [Flavonifractor sp. An82]|nr:hypothetical protein [Flavonifractor sp. An82]